MSKIKTLYLPEGAMYPFDTEEEAQRFLIEKELRRQGREELKVFFVYIRHLLLVAHSCIVTPYLLS